MRSSQEYPSTYTHFAENSLIDGRLLEEGTYELPIDAMIGNIPTSQLERPSLLSFEKLGNLLDEFSHVLRAILNPSSKFWPEHLGRMIFLVRSLGRNPKDPPQNPVKYPYKRHFHLLLGNSLKAVG